MPYKVIFTKKQYQTFKISNFQLSFIMAEKKVKEQEVEEQKTVLSRIRENMGLVVVVIAFSLAVFILTDFITGNKRMNTGDKGSLGTVMGEAVPRAEFDKLYQQRSDNYQKQGQSIGEAERYQLQDGIWNQLVSEKVLGAQYKSLGLTVSPEELQDMFTGKNISPVVKQYFDNFFKQNNKPFNTEDVKKYLNQAIQNEEEKVNLKQFEDYLINARMREKFDAMVSAGYVSSKAQATRKNIEQNRKFNVSFVGVPFSQIVDSTIKVEDNELLAYMAKYPAKYKQEDQSILKFVQFDLKPTKEDTLKARTDVMKYREKFAATKDDSSFVYSRSRKKLDPKKYVAMKDLPAAAKDSVKLLPVKSVFGPVLDGDAYKLFKIVDKKSGDAVNANVRQIVIMPKSPSAADSAAAIAEATAIKAMVNAGNFTAIASEKSQDMQSKMNGGSIGWVSTPSQYGKAFDDAIKGAAKGAIVGPIKGNQGYQILYVEDKTDEGFLVAEVEKIISVSSTTASNISKNINDFAQKAIAAKDIEAAGKAANVPTKQSNPLKNNEKFVSGIPARELVLWAITAKEGDFSKVFNMGDSYVFAQVFKKQKAGLQDLADVKPVVMKEVLAEKKSKMILEKLEKLQGKSLEEIKTGYGGGAYTGTATDITFESQSAGSMGADPYLIGKICGMKKGATSKPIISKSGVYIVQVTDVVEPAALDAKVLETNKKSAASAGQSLIKSRIEQALIKSADVQDERWKVGI